MKTSLESIKERVESLRLSINGFISKYVIIEYLPWPSGYIGFSEYKCRELNEDGKKMQAEIYKKYKDVSELIRILIIDIPKQYIDKINLNESEIFSYIELSAKLFSDDKEEIIDIINKNLNNQLKIIDEIFLLNENKCIFVPDTNALLYNSNLEKWSFGDVDKFEIIITPTVLSELDNLKVFGKNEKLRNNAKKIIRVIKEYRRRGSLIEGVIVRKDKISLRAIPIEPNFERTFSWLDSGNNDDRLIASFVEVIRKYPNAYVKLVTADINLQNKVEYADLSYVEPPQV